MDAVVSEDASIAVAFNSVGFRGGTLLLPPLASVHELRAATSRTFCVLKGGVRVRVAGRQFDAAAVGDQVIVPQSAQYSLINMATGGAALLHFVELKGKEALQVDFREVDAALHPVLLGWAATLSRGRGEGAAASASATTPVVPRSLTGKRPVTSRSQVQEGGGAE